MSALIDVAAANVGLEVLVAAIAGTGVGAVAVTAGGVLPAVGQGGSREPVVRALVDINAHPVSPGPDTLVAVIAVLVSLAAVGPVATPGVRRAPPPAAFIAGAEPVDLRQVGMLAERKVSPVSAAGPAPVVVAGGQTVGVGGAGTLVGTALSVCGTFLLTTIVSIVPISTSLGGAVI